MTIQNTPVPGNPSPVLTPEILQTLSLFQKELVWSFDALIEDAKNFIIQYYPDESPDLAMKTLADLQLIQRSLRELVPESE